MGRLEVTHRQKQVLDRTCREIMARFPGITAAYEGFTSPTLDLFEDGMITVHVFDVPDDKYDDTCRFAFDVTTRASVETNVPVTFSLWDVEETETYFREDVERLKGFALPGACWDYLPCSATTVRETSAAVTVSLERTSPGMENLIGYWDGTFVFPAEYDVGRAFQLSEVPEAWAYRVAPKRAAPSVDQPHAGQPETHLAEAA